MDLTQEQLDVIAAKTRLYRSDHKLSQIELAEKCSGVSQSHVSKVENARPVASSIYEELAIAQGYSSFNTMITKYVDRQIVDGDLETTDEKIVDEDTHQEAKEQEVLQKALELLNDLPMDLNEAAEILDSAEEIKIDGIVIGLALTNNQADRLRSILTLYDERNP